MSLTVKIMSVCTSCSFFGRTRAAGSETKLSTLRETWVLGGSCVRFPSNTTDFVGSLCSQIRFPTTTTAICKCQTAALHFLAAQILRLPTGTESAACRCYTRQWNSCYTYCNLVAVCLLLEQRTQLEALVLGGRVTAQTLKHPHTLCVARATSFRTVYFFSRGEKKNCSVCWNVHETSYFPMWIFLFARHWKWVKIKTL